MRVILEGITFDGIDLVALAQLPYELPEPFRYLSAENLFTLFCAPRHVGT